MSVQCNMGYFQANAVLVCVQIYFPFYYGVGVFLIEYVFVVLIF
jgi:hypothetical protein